MNNPMWGNNYQNPYANSYAQPTNNSFILVQGIEGARSYQMAPNSLAILKDNANSGYFYIKTTDNLGVATIETYVKTEAPSTPTNDFSQFVKKDELAGLIKEIIGGMKNDE